MKAIISILLFLINNLSFSQNGKIISANPVTQPDSVKQFRIKRIPDFQKVFDSTKLSAIRYESEGLKIEGFIAEPKQPGKYPCIIWCRGGALELSKIDWWTTTILSEMASHGYVVIASQIRGTSGSEGKDEFGGADTMDIINCVPALANWPTADTSRIGMYGVSRGGMMIYQTLRTLKNIKAAVLNSGSADAYDAFKRADGAEWDSLVYGAMIPHYYQDKSKALQLRSAVYWPEKINKKTPLLIMHGSSDWRVTCGSTLNLVQKLYELKHPVRFIMYEGGVHVLGNVGPTRDIHIWEWFDKFVKKKGPLPNMELQGK
jgi:dipeptidyl aminopeptidase/acylaminoacyl peptidase